MGASLPQLTALLLGPCREKLQRGAEALQDFRRAAELEPHNAEARQGVSRLQELPPPPPLAGEVSMHELLPSERAAGAGQVLGEASGGEGAAMEA